jgi:hypothetical protein
MKLLLEKWNRFLKENLDKQDVEELLDGFETNNQEIMSRGRIAYNTLQIGQDLAKVDFICEVVHPDHKLRASIEQIQNKFMQDYGSKIGEYEVSPTFIKDKYRDDFVIEYRIPIQIYNGSIHENIREKISDIDSFEQEVVERFIDENPEMFGSPRQREVPLGENCKSSSMLLNEIKMEQVMPRFESKAFLKAVEMEQDHMVANLGADSDAAWSFTPERRKEDILKFLPSDIQERYKPEALNWMINEYIRSINQDTTIGLGYVRKRLETFYQIKEAGMDRLLSIRDINSIKSAKELNDVIEQAKPAWEEYKQKKAEKDAGAGSNEIYEDEDWKVFIPENKGAACELGKGTDWCTAAPGLEYYKQYHKPDDPLIIFISKKDPTEKYQFHYGTEQFMDKYDDQLDPKTFKLYRRLHSIVANSDKVPMSIRQKASEISDGYEALPNGAYKIKSDGRVIYYNAEGKKDRKDGPAQVDYHRGQPTSEHWYQNGQLHREDGPAAVYFGSPQYNEWWKNGKLISKGEPKSLQEIIKQELIKVLQEEWSKSERNKRKSKCSNPKGFTMKQFCKNQKTRSKRGEKTNEGLEEERKLGKPSSEKNLGDWFKRKGAPGKTGGWVDCNTCRNGKCKPCGRQEDEKRGKYPRCRPTPSQCKGYKRRGDNLQKEE